MNIEAKEYFERFKEKNHLDEKLEANAFQFGVDADVLLDLVINGEKTATCSWKKAYDIEGEPLPEKGQYDVILDSEDQPGAIIQNVDVFLSPMNQVPEEFAIAEGEGDKTYKYWWNEHVRFFTEYAEELGTTFSTEDVLVCERFKCVDVKRRFIE